MSGRSVDTPPANGLRNDGTLLGGWWHDAEDGGMVCDLCPRECHLKPGDRGFCFVRQNRDGEMVLTTYGKSTGFCIDPIEKKPLNHFYPGTSVLSFGTAGCNLGCKFCQNHDISKARKVELLSENAMPDAIARAAIQHGCKSVAYTYNDPIIWAEYAIDTAKACREVGVKSVAVTAGYISEQARAPFFEFFDAANVDLKAFSEEFYEKVTLSHMQPVLDTLAWLKRETDVWFEITNLIIPDANDSPDELRQLCDWVLKHVGDKVPVHFSAFHPDFRMLDRPRTPHEKLIEAHAIAKSTGLKHVYMGNVHDAEHQSTYCDACGELVIERDWYQLGKYHLAGATCQHCGHQLDGRFADSPGDWGRKRQPVKISEFGKKEKAVAIKANNSYLNELTPEQSQAVLVAASELVTSAVLQQASQVSDSTVGGVADARVNGVYVSLKRQGQLRGCCGFTGRDAKLIEGMELSAARTALEDPRLPPVSASELPYLDVEVWMLGGLLPVDAKPRDRVSAIKVGRDGLLIQRGKQRGLLLPGVATDNRWDEETFLNQVCVKAKLPPTAWREADTNLMRFEGIVAKGDFFAKEPSETTSVVDATSIEALTKFCRENVLLLSKGALPNYYVPNVSDGMVYGFLLTATAAQGRQLHVAKISLRPPFPLQSTLFSLCENLVNGLRRSGVDPLQTQIDLAVFEDPAMHGNTQAPDLRGLDGRCVYLLGAAGSAIGFDPNKSVDETFGATKKAMGLRADQVSSVFSFRTHTSAPVNWVNAARPVAGADIRPPGVAGKFYPATASALSSMVRKLVPAEPVERKSYRAAMVPHAGLQFSGRIAAEVMARIEFPKKVIVIGPKHTRNGVDWAVAPHAKWSAPGIEVANDRELAARLQKNVPYLQLDAVAHQAEHSIEVELPFLHHYGPDSSVVGIVVGTGTLGACREFAEGLAKTLQETSEDVLLLISSDMNHFASDAETRRLDELALTAIETLDTAKIFNTVRNNNISMCGLLPAVITLDALSQLAELRSAERVNYATSADVTNDKTRCVGYAGMLFN